MIMYRYRQCYDNIYYNKQNDWQLYGEADVEIVELYAHWNVLHTHMYVPNHKP